MATTGAICRENGIQAQQKNLIAGKGDSRVYLAAKRAQDIFFVRGVGGAAAAAGGNRGCDFH